MKKNVISFCSTEVFFKGKVVIMLFFIFFCSLLSSCSLGEEVNFNPVSVENKAVKSNYGHLYLPNQTSQNAFKGLFAKTRTESVHIVQLGDSHTAADVFTGKIRTLLQSEFGDGGIGFLPPSDVVGIRSDLVKISSPLKYWQLTSSRKEQNSDFPLGGYLLATHKSSGSVNISPRNNSVLKSSKMDALVLYASELNSQIKINNYPIDLLKSSGNWTWSDPIKNLFLPLTIDLPSNIKLGGYFLKNSSDHGIIFSTLGINGAQLNATDKWDPIWKSSLAALDPELIILAYGTNEAYGNNLDLNDYKRDLNRRVLEMKNKFPKTQFLLLGPPDSIKNSAKANLKVCDPVHSEQLRSLINIQKEISFKHGLIFWDWQASMGGKCSIAAWYDNNLAKKDLVHLTAEGYEKSAILFVRDIKKLLAN